ncbi:hypothetical protein [Arundinibacter roseus]|uniref:hypothetical protein n=1 Tax=Arundinibacter roseus TaxID=2070510 RepID=UPI001404922F|nr:hypothetical protein [Arundinibacter roseus]
MSVSKKGRYFFGNSAKLGIRQGSFFGDSFPQVRCGTGWFGQLIVPGNWQPIREKWLK